MEYIKNKFRPFRFFCQKVLPLVYDESLSYYEVLNKVVDYLNAMIKDLGEFETAMEAEVNEAVDYMHNNIESVTEQYLDDHIEQFILGASYDAENTAIRLHAEIPNT